MSAASRPLAAAPSAVEGLLAGAVARLAAAGVGTPRLDARLLLAHASKRNADAFVLSPDRITLNEAEIAAFHQLVGRRAGRMPLAYLTGHKEFWSLDLAVSEATLIPRPDSETLIESGLALLSGRQRQRLSVADIGCGSGALLLAALSALPAATGVGCDCSEKAVDQAARNGRRLGPGKRARFVRADWCRPADAGWRQLVAGGPYDLVLCNPPYIPDADIDGLAPEVAAFEPRVALAGGADGLASYRRLAPLIGGLLAPGGHAVLELGGGQAGAVAEIVTGAGLAVIGTSCDLASVERCITVKIG